MSSPVNIVNLNVCYKKAVTLVGCRFWPFTTKSTQAPFKGVPSGSLIALMTARLAHPPYCVLFLRHRSRNIEFELDICLLNVYLCSQDRHPVNNDLADVSKDVIVKTIKDTEKIFLHLFFLLIQIFVSNSHVTSCDLFSSDIASRTGDYQLDLSSIKLARESLRSQRLLEKVL
jgi:hypothetical protein